MIQTIRLRPQNPILQELVKYFWIIRSQQEVTIHHKLLPVGNIDFILNLSAPIRYLDSRGEMTAPLFHFNGIHKNYRIIHQTGKLNVFGISFSPAGLFPFLKTPLFEFTGRTVGLNVLVRDFTARLGEAIGGAGSIHFNLTAVEDELIRLLDTDLLAEPSLLRIVDEISLNPAEIPIHSLCDRLGVHPRKLERDFHKYLGVSPKFYQRLTRFQKGVGRMIRRDFASLTSLAYDYEYWDQAHFTKEFQSFAGCSPRQFIRERRSVKEILECR